MQEKQTRLETHQIYLLSYLVLFVFIQVERLLLKPQEAPQLSVFSWWTCCVLVMDFSFLVLNGKCLSVSSYGAFIELKASTIRTFSYSSELYHRREFSTFMFGNFFLASFEVKQAVKSLQLYSLKAAVHWWMCVCFRGSEQCVSAVGAG